MPGPFVYAKVDTLVGKPLVGSKSCAVLVQYYVNPGLARTWTEGLYVKGNGAKIKKGTAIATFVDGKYPNKSSGNHAAFYLSQDAKGIWVVEQFKGLTKIQKRHLRFKGKASDGSYVDPSNNGDAFSVIMR